jgi:fatty acid desaturase
VPEVTSPPFDPARVDVEALVADLREIRRTLDEGVGAPDLAHLRRIERWGRTSSALGYATAWMAPNPISAALISQGILTRWLVAHHVSHRGYDRLSGVPARHTSRVFARGRRRLLDWMDWILPEAWHEEHDVMHHYHLGEQADPDLLEQNAAWMEERRVPAPLRAALIGGLALTWKWLYYAPSTLDVLQRARARRARAPEPPPAELLSPFNARGRELWRRCLLPHALWRFVALPAVFLPLGPGAAANVLINSIAAELLTNLHAFLIIGPNHTADDLYRFDTPARSKGEFYLRQIVGSANYTTGSAPGRSTLRNDVVDYLQMWLNYQIEHHLWPDLTMLQYRRAQPLVAAACARHGVPYVQESVFRRAGRMLRVLLGRTRMRRLEPGPRPDRAAAEPSPSPHAYAGQGV